MATRVEQLNRKGILSWEVDGVLGRLTKAQSKDEEFALRMKPLVELGVILAVHMKERVQGKSILAGTSPVAPSDKTGRHKEGGEWVPGQVVSAEYAAAAGLPTTTFPSVAALKEAAGKTGVGNTSGGMWGGLQARGSGQSVIIDFGGNSAGHGTGKPVLVEGAPSVDTPNGKPIPTMVRSPEMVRNQAKAWVVFTKHGCSPLEPLENENQALCEAATAMAQRAVVKTFGDSGESNQRVAEFDFGGDPSLRDKLMKGWVNK